MARRIVPRLILPLRYPTTNKWACLHAGLSPSFHSVVFVWTGAFENGPFRKLWHHENNSFLCPSFPRPQEKKMTGLCWNFKFLQIVWKPRSLNLPATGNGFSFFFFFFFHAFSFYGSFVLVIFCSKHGLEVYLDHSPWVRTTQPVVWSLVDNLVWKLISIVAILLICYQNIAFPRGKLKTIEFALYSRQ